MPVGERRKGAASDELFLSSPSQASPPPLVEPLRIHKRTTSHGSQGSSSSGAVPQPPQGNQSLPYPLKDPERRAGGDYYYPAQSSQLPYPDRSAAERLAQQSQQSGRPKQDSPAMPHDNTASPATVVSPARHVSVVVSDAYPTPPAHKHREGGRPGRVTKPTPPPNDQLYEAPPQSPGQGEEHLNPYPNYHQQYWPPPSRMTSLNSTAGRRGSPPPPPTPATATTEKPPADLGGHQRAPTSRVPVFDAPSAQTPLTQHGPSEPVVPPARPWTPTETPGSYPHGPPTVWHGTGGQNSVENLQAQDDGRRPVASEQAQTALEQDFQRMNMSASPPPSYASLSHSGSSASHRRATTAQGYPDEKRTVVVGAATPDISAVQHSSHPAFQHPADPASPVARRTSHTQSPANSIHSARSQQYQQLSQPQQHFSPPPQGHGPSAPPPLPEGWMAHLDPSSGAYYYIHVPSSHTQWEPPAFDAVASAPPPPASVTSVASTPAAQPASVVPALQSPGFAPSIAPSIASPGFPPKVDTFASRPPSIASSAATTGYPPFQPPPPTLPTVGISVYNPTPVNGEYFGPYLRYTNISLEHGMWYGSIMLISEYQQPPTIHLHRSRDLSPNPPQLKSTPIHTHRTWVFFRYDVEVPMEGGEMWTYAVSTPMGCTRYEFLVAGREERTWRFIAHSCNDFSVSVKPEEKARLGGPGFMWKDLMQKHLDCGGFHAQLGGGDQIYADRMWKEIPALKEWLQIKGKDNRKNAPWSAKADEDVTHAYFHYYTSTWDQPHVREAFAQIPYLFQLDDHDIFDGFGSYAEHMQFSNFFKNIGRIGTQWYLLFQHHTTLDILHGKTDENDLFTITGTGWHFIKYMGPAVAIIGLDTRSERNQHQVMAGPSYQGIFPKIAGLPSSVQHAIFMLGVPIIYPRLETAEHVVSTVATGKKAVTGTYNLLGKVVGSAAGVIGAKDMVNSGFQSVKKSVGKHGLMGGVVNVFGEVDLLDDLRDHWTHESKDLERTYLIRTLQGVAHQRSLRITFLSGDVQVCGAGLVHDPNKPSDHKTMFQIITSGIVNVPPPSYIIKLLHNNKILYLPQNGLRSTNAVSDTKEDMLELFKEEVDGRPRELRKLMGKRNYAIFTAFEADTVQGKSLSLAVDFIVQGEGVYAQTGKYGPVVVPRLEPGW